MPNTLAHIGIQGWVGRVAFRNVDERWVLLGLIIPDLPWISQRLALAFLPGVDLYDLRAYVIIQASLFGCIWLCGAFALIARESKKVFLVLSGNALLHLLLDATQYKWANGVHLFVPFSWKPMGFGWFWPENWPSLMLTLTGLAFIIASFKRLPSTRPGFRFRPIRRPILSILFLCAYFFIPILLLSGPYDADNHFLSTLKQKTERAGKNVEIDRNEFRTTAEGPVLKSAFGETIQLEGNVPKANAIVSLKGKFTNPETIRVDDYHVHSPLRDWFSYAGLGWILFWWIFSFFRDVKNSF